MSTKVLVFESDAAFAAELRNELAKLGCATSVVDDGNAGLQQAASDKPDLILLSIELPRMNGFSVCNKLKKDGRLKEVPLIIMSTESSDETFDQHKKLRTRAEDYVHKPIAFGELLQHINQFVKLAAPEGAAEGEGIVIDDEISSIDLEEEGTLVVEDGAAGNTLSKRTSVPAAKMKNVDEDIDAFIEGGFGKMTGTPQNGAQGATAEAKKKKSVVPPADAPDEPAPVDDGRLAALEKELEKAHSDAAQLRADFDSRIEAEQKRMDGEMEELRSKLATAGKGGVSSREFLDLREALNKKDKEILALKEHLGKKDKEIVDIREKALAFERTKSDLDDKMLIALREIEESREKLEALGRDKDQAKKASEDFKNRLAKTQSDLETRITDLNETKARLATTDTELQARTQELEDARAKAAEDSASLEAAAAAARADYDSALAKERADRTAAIEAAQAEKAAALEAAEQKAIADMAETLQVREAELKAESDSRLGSLHRAHQEEVNRVRAEHAQEKEGLAGAHAGELATAHAKHGEELDEVRSAAAGALAAREAELEAKRAAELQAAEERRVEEVSAVERDRDEKISTLERDRDEKISTLGRDRDEKISALERDRDEKISALERDRAEKVSAIESDRNERVSAAERDRDERVAATERDRDEKLAAVERAKNEAVAAAADDRDRRVADIERSRDEQVGTLRAELAQLAEAKENDAAQAGARITNLDQRVTDLSEDKDRLEREVASAKDRVVLLEAETAALRTELAEAKAAHAREISRADKAFAKWEADRAALERAKDALAVVLGQIEDAEGRPIS